MSLTSSRNWTGLAIFLYGTAAAVLVAFILYGAQRLVVSTIDLNGFGVLSRNIADGKGFSLGFGPTLRRAPLYPLLGAALLKLFVPNAASLPDAIAYRPILIANCLIFGLTCVTTWAIARRLFSPRVAIVAGLLCPLLPQSLRYVGMTEVETLMGLMIALMAFTGLRLLARPSLSTGAWFGLSVAAATLTKPVTELYVFVLLVLAWCYWRLARSRHPQPHSAFVSRPRVVASVAALLFFALPLLPWVARNLVVTNGQFIGISTNGPGEFIRGYINVQPKYFLLRQNFSGVWDAEADIYEDRLLRQHSARFYWMQFPANGGVTINPPVPAGVTSAQIEVQKDRIEGAEVKRLVLHHPFGLIRKFLIQLATFWYIVETRSKSILVGASALLVLALATLGFLDARRRGILTWPVVAILVYLNLTYAVSLAFARYSMPLFPTLLVLSAGGLASLAPRFVRFFTPHRQGDLEAVVRGGKA